MVTIAEVPLLILVGLTGVGKTTTVQALELAGVELERLPGRREVTDERIIGFLQQQDGQKHRAVVDRRERFDYTRRYRELFPGGMAQALEGLDVPETSRWLLFDGLRGRNEVEHAARTLPLAWFLVLQASNAVRVERLLVREDAFDQVKVDDVQSSDLGALLADYQEMLADEPSGGLVGDAKGERRLSQLVERGEVTTTELRGKLAIVAKEHQNYSAEETHVALLQAAPERSIVVRTDQLSPPEIARRVVESLPGLSSL